MKFVLTFALGATFFLTQSASADVFGNFFQDLLTSKIPTASIQIGMSQLNGVNFKSEDEMGPAAAFFYMGTDEIGLNQSTQDPATGMLKHVADLGAVDSSIIIHELWHSFYWNSFQHGGGAALALYNQEYQTRYDNYPSEVREEIQEEGYALYIQEVARDYLQTYMILSRATPEQRKALKANPNFVRLYAQGFTENSYGYYRGDDGMPVFVTTPITAADRASILTFFFGNKLKGDLAKDFPQWKI